MAVQTMLRTDRVAALLDRKTLLGQLSAFEEAQILKEIGSLSKIDPIQADSIRAVCLGAEGKFEEACALHKKVIEQDPAESAFIGNYATCLAIFGKHQEAYEVFMQAWLLDKTNKDFLEKAIDMAVCLNRTDLVNSLNDQYQTLTGEPFRSVERTLLTGSDVTAEYCFSATVGSSSFSDWDRPEEEEAWQHLQ